MRCLSHAKATVRAHRREIPPHDENSPPCELKFLDNREGYRLKKEKGINFLDYYQSYISSYSKKDIRMIQLALNRFQYFLAEYHPLLKDFIRPDAITHEMMVKFAEYLQTRSVGEGAKSILQRFKKVVRSAVD